MRSLRDPPDRGSPDEAHASTSGLRIRPLTPGDLDGMVRLHRRAFGEDKEPERLEEFLRDVFFDHPWTNPERPSLGCEASDGRLLGCLGAMPRPMLLHGAPTEVLITHDFIMDPQHRGGLPAIELLRRMTRAGQDATLAQANPMARRISEALGARPVPQRSSRWVRLLRPTGFAVHMLDRWLTERGAPTALGRLAAFPDVVARSVPSGHAGPPSEPSGEERTIDVDLIQELLLRQSRGLALRPVYTAESLGWLVDVLARTRRDQTLRGAVVVTGGRPVGWYLYYARNNGVGRVLQLGSEREHRALVLSHLFSDALKTGNVAVTGSCDPVWDRPLKGAGCFTRPGRTTLLVHSSDPRFLSALKSDDAFFGPLEGEGWLQLGY